MTTEDLFGLPEPGANATDMLVSKAQPVPYPGDGVVQGMSNNEYHAVAAVNASTLKIAGYDEGDRCWADVRAYLDGEQQLSSYDMMFGSAAHAWLLEDNEDLVIEVKKWENPLTGNLCNVAGSTIKPMLDACERAHPGQYVVGLGDKEVIRRMVERCREHPRISDMLSIPSSRELTLFWTDEETGLPCKARIDWWTSPTERTHGVYVDYKTARSIKGHLWSKQFEDLGYWFSAGWYGDGIVATGLDRSPLPLWIAQEKDKTFQCRIFECDSQIIEYGRYLSRDLLRGFAQCVAEDRWPGVHTNNVMVTPRPWMIREVERRDEIRARSASYE